MHIGSYLRKKEMNVLGESTTGNIKTESDGFSCPVFVLKVGFNVLEKPHIP